MPDSTLDQGDLARPAEGVAQSTVWDHLRHLASACQVAGARLRLDLTEMPFIGSSPFDAETTQAVGRLAREAVEKHEGRDTSAPLAEPGVRDAAEALLWRNLFKAPPNVGQHVVVRYPTDWGHWYGTLRIEGRSEDGHRLEGDTVLHYNGNALVCGFRGAAEMEWLPCDALVRLNPAARGAETRAGGIELPPNRANWRAAEAKIAAGIEALIRQNAKLCGVKVYPTQHPGGRGIDHALFLARAIQDGSHGLADDPIKTASWRGSLQTMLYDSLRLSTLDAERARTREAYEAVSATPQDAEATVRGVEEETKEDQGSLAEQAKHHGRDWSVWWHGSGPERGDHIMECRQGSATDYARELAWIGDQHHEQAHTLVNEHNEQVRRLREVIGRQAAAKALLQAELGRIKAVIPASLAYEVPDAAEAIASTFREYVKVAAEATVMRAMLAAAPSELETGDGGQPMDTASKDGPILAYCDHEADPWTLDGGKTLTLYAAHAEGMRHVPTGFHIVEWGGAFDDRTFEFPNGAHLADWWFIAGSKFEVAANPVKWWPLPALRPAETRGPSDGDGSQGAPPIGGRLSSDDQTASRSAGSAASILRADQWLPIKTAPKDGREILVFCDHTQEQFVVVWDGDWIYARGEFGTVACEPDRWQPVPLPPAQGIEAEGRDRQGSVHESPVGEADAPEPTPSNTVATPLDPASTPADPRSDQQNNGGDR